MVSHVKAEQGHNRGASAQELHRRKQKGHADWQSDFCLPDKSLICEQVLDGVVRRDNPKGFFEIKLWDGPSYVGMPIQ
jgi:hypothetical protein